MQKEERKSGRGIFTESGANVTFEENRCDAPQVFWLLEKPLHGKDGEGAVGGLCEGARRTGKFPQHQRQFSQCLLSWKVSHLSYPRSNQAKVA